MTSGKDQKTIYPQGDGPGDSFFDNDFELDCDDDFIIISVKMYKFFMAHGKDGLDAKMLYEHLIFTSRVQGSKKVRANLSYIKNGLGWGNAKVKKAKAFLSAAGLIQYAQSQSDSGLFAGGKIVIKTSWDLDSLHAWIDKKASSQQDDSKELPVDNLDQTGGSESEPTEDIAVSDDKHTISPVGQLTVQRLTDPTVPEHNYKGSYKKEISPQEENPPPVSSPPTAGLNLGELKEKMIDLVKNRTKETLFYFTPKEADLLKECFNKYGPEWVMKRFETYMKSKTASQINRFHSTDFPKVLQRAMDKSFKQAAPADLMTPISHRCPVCGRSWSASSTLSSCPGCGMEVKDFKNPIEVEAHRQWFESYQEDRNRSASG